MSVPWPALSDSAEPPESDRPGASPAPPRQSQEEELDELARDVFVVLVGHGLRVWDDLARDAYAAAAAFLSHLEKRAARRGP